jgi:pimeloyl-ACP methyl ester carboxylesterase
MLVLVLTGCGGSQRPTAPPLPSVEDRCGSFGESARDAGTFWFDAADGIRLDGAELGRGPRGVVLLHQSPSDLCEWADFGAKLAADGFHVLLVDLRGFGRSRGAPIGRKGAEADVLGAFEELERRGAERIAVVGASYGGVHAVIGGAALGARAAGVASLSGELVLREGGADELNALAAAPRLRAPFLLLGSRRDRWLDEREARRLIEAVGSKRKTLVEFDGESHGIALVDLPRGEIRLTAFLRSVTK